MKSPQDSARDQVALKFHFLDRSTGVEDKVQYPTDPGSTCQLKKNCISMLAQPYVADSNSCINACAMFSHARAGCPIEKLYMIYVNSKYAFCKKYYDRILRKSRRCELIKEYLKNLKIFLWKK